MTTNNEAPWDQFDSVSYCATNYSALRPDDQLLLALVLDFLEECPPRKSSYVLDIGAGPNLYPALLLLPYASEIVLADWAPNNIDWLKQEIEHPSANWDCFWDAASARSRSRSIDFRPQLRDKARVRRMSIFDLPPDRWDVGCMFFVAESITTSRFEFEDAVRSFVGSIRPGGLIIAAFMENSQGYDVASLSYPAVTVTIDDVSSAFEPLAARFATCRVDIIGEPLRSGYTGQILVTGTR